MQPLLLPREEQYLNPMNHYWPPKFVAGLHIYTLRGRYPRGAIKLASTTRQNSFKKNGKKTLSVKAIQAMVDGPNSDPWNKSG